MNETGVFVNEKGQKLSSDQFLKLFEEEMNIQLENMHKTGEWEEFTNDYERKTLDLLGEIIASATTYDILEAMLQGIESESIVKGRSTRAKAGLYGNFIESNLFGLSANSSADSDIIREVEGTDRKIELKASTVHKSITVGELTMYDLPDAESLRMYTPMIGMSGKPESYTYTSKGQTVTKTKMLERVLGGQAFSDIRNVAALYKMVRKMNNLLIIKLEEVARAGRNVVKIQQLLLFTNLLLSKLKERIESGKYITVDKVGGYDKDKRSQKFTITINIEGEKAMAKLAELYARKTDITHLLHNLNSNPTKMNLIRIVRDGEFFRVQE